MERAGAHAWHIMDEGDASSHHFLVDALRQARPDDAILSEEGRDSPNRLTANRVWIIDPLDGTNEFGETGRSDWAVHVALVREGRPIAAAVALPALQRTYATEPAPPFPHAERRAPRIVVSRHRAPYASALITTALGGELLRLGS